MKRILIYIFLTLLISIVVFNSCSKKDEKLIGEWEYVWVMRNDSNEVRIWSFNASNKVKVTTTVSGNTTVYEGNYTLDKKTFKGYYLYIDDLYPWIDGTFRIVTLNKEILVMQRVLDKNDNYAFERYEFVRK